LGGFGGSGIKGTNRECLHLAVSIDHDIIDAEPIAQFISSFVDLLESGTLLEGEIA
jgi:pyruvate/2-oxoglutarate dehydrogenase complex dihydrolipoamide acyltransferase (E2) component